MIADSAMELYSAKLMVLHAAYKIENGLPFRQEVSFAKHHVANMLWKIVDRAERMMRNARSARLVDGADEVHQYTIARNVLAAFQESGSTRSATGDLL
jgi:acyl-CoA dehydrogenase